MIGAAVLTLAAGATGAWWWLGRHAAAPDPPMPTDINEPEVLAALQPMRQEVLDHPHSGSAWGRLGMVFLAQLFDHEATFCFTEAGRLEPADPRWPYGLGIVALKRDPDNALPLLRQAADAADALPDHPSAYRLQLAEALLERGQLEEAEAMFLQVKHSGSDDLRVALSLGMVAQARGDDQAAETFLNAARPSPYARKAATARLAILARARHDDTAAAALDKETADLPDDTPWPDPFRDRIVELQVGRRKRERQIAQLESEHRYSEVADLFLTEIRDRPTATAYAGAGINLARAGDYQQALPLLREGVRRDPDSVDVQFALALTLFTRAEKEWREKPGDAQLRAWFEEAVEHARKATELKPDHAQAYLFWGLSLKYLGKSAEAVGPLRKGVACRPEQIELQLGLGEALLESGQPKEAATYLENARRLDPKDPRPAQDLELLRKKAG